MTKLCRAQFAHTLAMGVLSIVVASGPSQPASGETADRFAQAPAANPSAELKNVRSVMGIEVRSSTERNIGRVVDLLADRSGGVEAAVIEFGGFLGIGTRKIAIGWSTLRFEHVDNQLVAILDIPRDQLRVAPDYKPDQPTVTNVITPVLPSVEEPPYKIKQPLAPNTPNKPK
jgi:hypothetical protein